MAENRVKITITADGKDAVIAIKKLNKNLAATQGETVKAGKSMRDLSSDSVALVGAFTKMRAASLKTEQTFAGLGIDARKLGSDLGLTDKAFVSLQSRMIKTQAARAQEDALRDIAKAADLTEDEIKDLGRQLKLSDAQISKVNTSLHGTSDKMTKAGGSSSIMGTAIRGALAYMTVSTVLDFGKAVFDAGLQMDSMTRSFGAVFGSQQQVQAEFGFLREEAERLGQNFYDLTGSYKSISAASKGTALEGEATRKVFSSITEASAALGLTSDQTSGALQALEQMISKGTVQAEELRGQLGERLPGAFQLAARSMGVSTQELGKMLEKGEVLAEDLLPALADELHNTYGAAAETAGMESGQAAVNRLSEAWTDLKTSMSDTEAAAAGINTITGALVALRQAIAPTVKELEEELDRLENAVPEWDELMQFDFQEEATIEAIDRVKKKLAELKGVSVAAAEDTAAAWRAAEAQGLEDYDTYHADRIKREHELAAESEAITVKSLQRKGDILTTWEKTQLKAYEKAEADKAKAAEAAAKKDVAVQAKALKKQLDAAIKEGKAELKALEKAYNEKQDLLEDFEDAYEKSLGDQYEFERKAIKAQAKEWAAVGADRVKVAAWAEKEIEKVNKEELKDAEDTFRKEAIAGNDFFDGLKAGYADNLKYARTWGKTGYDIMRDFAQESGDVVGDVLFDAIKGDMDNLGDYWESFWDSMLRSMTDYVGQMATEWATSTLLEWGGSMLSNLITFHTGMVDLEDDELVAKLQHGEMVIPAKQADTIRAAIGSGGTSKDAYFSDVAGAVDMGTRVGSFGGWGPTTQADIAANMGNALVSQSIMGALTGWSNYGTIMDQAERLSGLFDIDMSMAKDFALDQAIATGLSRSFTGFVGTFMGSTLMDSMGLTDEFGSVSTMFGSKAIAPEISGMITAAAMSLLGLGPATAAIAAAISPLTGLAVSGIADLLDLRPNEVAKDSLEDAYGEIAGRQIAQALGRSFGVTVSDVVGKEVYGYRPAMSEAYEDIKFREEDVRGMMTQSIAEQVNRSYGTIGAPFASAMFDTWDAPNMQKLNIAKDELAKAILSDRWGFASYDVRKMALEYIGYTSSMADSLSHGDGYDGPMSPEAYGEIGTMSYSRADGSDGSESGWGGMADSGGIGGMGGTTGNTPGGGTGSIGRWSGGPVSPGYMYEINERGQELFMPGVDGRILTASETSEMLATLKTIASQGASRTAPSSGQPIVVQVVLDGEVIQESMVEGMRNMSDMGMPVVNSRGVYQEL